MFGEKRATEGNVLLPFNSKELKNKEHIIVANKFKDLGFFKIEETCIDDIGFDIFNKVNKVETVTIDGNDKFKINDEIPLTAKIRITYHVKSNKSSNVYNLNEIKFKGKWVQCHKGGAIEYFAEITDEMITIYKCIDINKETYWHGTFKVETFSENMFIESINNKVMTDSIENATHSDNKRFYYDGKVLTFETIDENGDAVRIALEKEY